MSKWAEKLRESGKKWLTSVGADQPQGPPSQTPATRPGLPPTGSGSGLIDASASSRAAAMGKSSVEAERDLGKATAGDEGDVSPQDRPHEYDRGSVLALCELLAVLLRRWGTGVNAANPVMQVSAAYVFFCSPSSTASSSKCSLFELTLSVVRISCDYQLCLDFMMCGIK